MNTDESGPLRSALETAMADGYKMKDLTVLAAQRDPFRLDTPAKHRDAAWLADQAARLPQETIHLRGLHYAVLGETKPDGKPYTNTEEDWLWLSEKAAKAARWLGYVEFDRIVDQRNAAPVVREFEPADPTTVLSVGNVELVLPEDLDPRVRLADFRAVQPHRLVLFGEKVSLEPVLAPIAEQRQADLYLPTGEASDTMIHALAHTGAQDGRRTVVFYLSDCDPAGWQMAVSVSRKLQALKVLKFPGLDFEVRPVALLPEQVREYGLPSTPLKSGELRAGAWERAMGVQQTEIDAIATLQPELLDRLVRRAIKPFWDGTLEERTREVRRTWEAEAQKAFEDALGEDQLDQLRSEAEDRLGDLEELVAEVNEQLRVEVPAGLALPKPPAIPKAEIDGVDGLPLLDSDWNYGEATLRLKAHRAYEGT